VSLQTSCLTSLESSDLNKALIPQLAQLSANHSHQHPPRKSLFTNNRGKGLAGLAKKCKSPLTFELETRSISRENTA
jgi:hypothetical protein